MIVGSTSSVHPPSISSVINFGENSIKLTKLALSKIENVAVFLKKHTGYVRVQLTGYADPLSKRAYNLRLGKQRSAVVRAQMLRDLKSLRVKGTVVTISSKGAGSPAVPGLSSAARAADRRVTVIVD
jgi:outer membrane protein OmpA-like peptidoglycan-associated protein